MSDLGLTHVALPVTDLDASLSFWSKYARMQVVHERKDETTGSRVAWISDRTRPFVIVLIELAEVKHPLLPIAHLGVGCESREEVDRLCTEARGEERPVWGPVDSGYPVGYWALLSDPDDHTLEVAHGQEVALAVARGEGTSHAASSPEAEPPVIDLHYWPTPNRWKVSIALEELALPYEVHYVDIGAGARALLFGQRARR